jgi:MSHA pilin protein MshC
VAHFAKLQSRVDSWFEGLLGMRLNADQVDTNKQEAEHDFGVPGNVRLFDLHAKYQRGFTLMELITVMVIIGIVAVVAVPRFFDRTSFASRGFNDQVISTLRYAQKAAVAQHRFVCVGFTVSSITLTYGTTAACTSGGLTSPTGQTPTALIPTVAAPSGVTFTAPAAGTTFSFDRLGRAIAPPATITVSGYTASIKVEAETGFVHAI